MFIQERMNFRVLNIFDLGIKTWDLETNEPGNHISIKCAWKPCFRLPIFVCPAPSFLGSPHIMISYVIGEKFYTRMHITTDTISIMG